MILLWVGFKLTYRMIFQLPYMSPTLGWNLGYIYLVIPVGFFLMTLRVIQARYRILRGRLAFPIGGEV
ncbi:MAG: TRAP transporter small permease subunit [Deltaproteobacteria bacterium]|nr:TRAP transporter small permease subunit [Deltaproteobacteria bacterium]MBW2149502.1 TRAP transporter small permease subunit [Deltaproteobacteria bacterium]